MESQNEINIQITDLSRGGQGVARSPEGQVYFVPFTTTGDQVRARVSKIEKRYVTTDLLEVLKPSEDRIVARCPVFTKCGGCEWQHVPYTQQWKKKIEGAKSALKRAQVESPAQWDEFPAKTIWNYRNRIQMRGENGSLGFFGRGTRNLIEVDQCAIAHPKINEAISKIKKEALVKKLRPYKVEIEMHNDEVSWAFNRPHASQGFRQVHDEQNAELVKFVSTLIPEEAIVYDLYGGTGNLSRDLLPKAKEVHCVDVTPIHAPRLEGFTQHKGATLPWLLKHRMDTKTNLHALLDPPREGLGDDAKEIFSALFQMGCEQVVLVGCDPDAWARDLRRALEVTRENGKGWQKAWTLMRCASFDFFPQTHHIESVAVLHRMS